MEKKPTRTSRAGFVRNDAKGKPRYDLIPTFLLDRLAALYAEGASRFGEDNWRLGTTEEDYKWFEASFMRHAMEYREGAENEDHLARCVFNLCGMENSKPRAIEVDITQEAGSQWGAMADEINNQ